MKKIVIINGECGVGKDMLCEITKKYYKTEMVSSIDPMKSIAKQIGWDGVKDTKSRKLLSELKRLCIEYNDFPTNYLLGEVLNFLEGEKEILFVQIREPLEIDKFKDAVKQRFEIICDTLLIRRGDKSIEWGNQSDDNVNNYSYDNIYINNLPADQVEKDFINFLSTKVCHSPDSISSNK